MPGIVTPPTIVEPFGVNADPSLITLPIPVASQIGVTPGAASFNDGFPPLTFLAEVAGGIPPTGQDFNGILYMVTASIAALQAGQPFAYNAAIVAAIGGYPVGIILGSADGTGQWINTIAANVTDPDGGAPGGWVPLFAYGQTYITGLTNANLTLSAAQWKRKFVVLNGNLTANIRVVFPTGIFQSWLIINNCTGAFTVNATTAAGTGVVVPAGGYSSPTGVYTDGANIQPSTAPLAVPISIAPTPSSLVERDNSGYVYATYLNQNSSSAENPGAISAIFVESGSDGFLRKSQPVSFIAALGLATTTAVASAIGTAISPLAPLASPTLTGNVGVPTRAPGDNSANAASTAFVQAVLGAVRAGSNTSGSFTLGAYIVNFGTTTLTTDPQTIAFQKTYPTACVATVPVGVTASVGGIPIIGVSSPAASRTSFTAYSSITGGSTITWISVGY